MNGSSTNISTKCLHTVVSKYFSSSPVMDESLSEFKEKKKGYTGPKNSAKPTGSKGRVKKPPKRIRGQKDIRSAINSKKNELVTYTKEFDEVCKLSGIDVDPEQLQLAIALSKSQELSAQECSSNQDAVLSAKERTGKIRTTLQEYGFTVPEVKVAGKKRQKKRHKKNYKLLQASEAEKQQIISDRYSQVLFENVYNYNKNACEHSITDQKLYFLSTSISYMDLRSNDVLYVDNLIEKSSSKGNLLRDWSDIPGRPESPRRETISMDFSDIECSQEEIDIILSGTLKSAKSVVHNKFKNMTNIPIIINIDDDINYQIKAQNKSVEKSENNGVQTLVVDEENCKNNSLHSTFNTLDRIRSKSPDIFDDSEISEVSNDATIKNFEDKNSIVLADSIDNDHRLQNMNMPEKCLNNDNIKNQTINNQNASIMDLTGDNDKTSDNLTACSPKVTSQFSKTINFTRRNSNDVMEITECVAVSTALNSFSIENRNKTKRISNDYMEMTDCVDIAQCSSVDIEDKIDLTQNVDENNDVNQVDAIVSAAQEKIVDLSQSSGSEDELPMVQISGSNKPSLDDTILLDRDEIIINDNILKSIDKEVVLQNKSSHDNSETLDLTQTPPKSNENESTSQSFFEEFIYNHSDEKIKETLDISNQSESINSKANDIEKIDLTQTNLGAGNIPGDIEVDLTQSSNSSNASMAYRSQSCSTPEKDLGKRDEVSIDYDDLFDDVAQGAIVNSETNNLSHQSRLSDLPDKEATNLESSKSSQVFDHSDKELEYSVNQSKVDLPLGVDFGGISVLDNMSGIGNRKSNISTTMNDSYLPAVSIPNVKQNIIRDSDEKNINKDGVIHKVSTKELHATPFKTVAHNTFAADTPNCSEYIIKTDQVTPMLDYASMSTPERNRELDKYGLKPFKRKRAIQLLTHLYNQTHPLIEPCQEDLPSPSKKMKPCIEASSMKHPNLPDKCMKSPAKTIKSPAKCKKSPAKTIKSPAKSQKSPTKCIKSPAKSQKSPTKCKKSPAKSMKSPKCSQNEIFFELYEDSNIFQVTNEVPDIRDIVCSEEDWIFQKREKAKLHTCRLPLHIALHNYVSCRRLLREAILRYEPVNIDVIHKELVASGYRYDPKELLKFMDKKCITVKTADNNGRNNNR